MDLMKKRKLEENGVVTAADVSVSVPATSRLTVEDARKMLESVTHEQMLEILQNAVIRHGDVLEQVRSIADRDTTQRKLFIRGLGWETTTEKLRAIFANYGELEEAVVILDKTTGKSKGYGFITFKHVDGALLALKEPSKKIDGRMTVTQLAAAGIQGGPGGGSSNNPVDVSLRKIYVANVPYDMPADRILQHFSMYGEIEEGPLGFDKATGKSKGYALFVYKTAEAARSSLVDPVKNIGGHQLTCKLAIDGKKGKPGPAGPGGAEVDGHGGSIGPGVQGGMGGQYGGPGGITGYGGFSGHLSFGGHGLNSTFATGNGIGMGGPGVASFGSQSGGSVSGGGYASGIGGPYGSAGYGPLGSAGGGGGFTGAGALGGPGGGLAGVGSAIGSAGRGSSMYGLPPSSTGMPTGDFPPQGSHYSLSSTSGQQPQSQQNQATGASTLPRVAPGGIYQGMPSYY